MEEEKIVKKNNKPMLVIALAFILIIAGIALEVTGNNIMFNSKNNNNSANEEKDDPVPEPEPDPEPDPKRGTISSTLTEEEVVQLINEKKAAEFSDETWSVGAVMIIGHDEEYEKYLVIYEEIQENADIIQKQTIISVLNDEKSVELPGWENGERDLTVYGFILDEPSVDENESTPEPTEPVNPSEQTETDDNVESPVVPAEDVQAVQPEELTVSDQAASSVEDEQ